jgi:hypothetical protein
MLKFHLAAEILKLPDQAGDGLGPVQPVEVTGPRSLQARGSQHQCKTDLGPDVTPEYGLITPIPSTALRTSLGHSVAQPIPGTLLHAPGSLRTDGQLFRLEAVPSNAGDCRGTQRQKITAITGPPLVFLREDCL